MGELDGGPGIDPTGLRERKKVETRRALMDAAVNLSSRRGFADTTVDDIAASVGVSARTFHRYFERKEDAILADSEARLDWFRAQLVASSGVRSVLDGVRQAASAMAEENAPREAHDRARASLISSTRSLRAYNLTVYDEWAATIAAHAAEAVGEQPSDRWPTIFGGCAMAALSSATRRWAADESLDLGREYAAAFDLIEGLDRPVRSPVDVRGAR